MKDKILLIDGMNFVWRAVQTFPAKNYHHEHCTLESCSHKSQSDHCTCGAAWDTIELFCYGDRYVHIFNFFRNLRATLQEFSPHKCFFVLEGRPKHRHELFTEYKANRIIKTGSEEKMEKFYANTDAIIKLLSLLPITLAKAADFECDDTISSLCTNMKHSNLTIITNDSDYIQLLQKGFQDLKIYNPIKKEYMQAPEYPYIPWKCLAGDKSDNIPALLTPKKALNCVTNPAKFKQWMSLEENRANFSINQKLITFFDVPEDEIILTEGTPNYSEIKHYFQSMRFNSITNDESWAKFCDTFNCILF